MKRRGLMVGVAATAGLVIVDRVLAQPDVAGGVTGARARLTGVEVTPATVRAIYQATSKVDGLGETTSPVVVLQEQHGERICPIWVGPVEGASIDAALHQHHSERPNSQELRAALVQALHGQIQSVSIVPGPQAEVFYAVLKVQSNGTVTEIDSRPSDALGLALRVNAPILVATALLKPITLEQLKADLAPKADVEAKPVTK